MYVHIPLCGCSPVHVHSTTCVNASIYVVHVTNGYLVIAIDIINVSVSNITMCSTCVNGMWGVV